MQFWKDTGYEAQMEMMKEAGLNPAMMYGQSGGGGQTTGSQTGGTASGGQSHAPMDIGAMISAAQTASQIKLMEAQTKKTQAEADSIRGGEGTIGESQVESNIANALDARSRAALNGLGLEGKTKLQGIQNDFILGTLGKEIDLMKLNVEQQKIFTSMFNNIQGKAK